jgi:glycosyltransferase involved in cell wall biosynthesis
MTDEFPANRLDPRAPRVSVLVNNYNYGRFLGQAIESALAQDFPSEELEVIVVDDGSTDDSRRVIDAFGARVRPVLLPQNRGQAAAFNAGFDVARGEIVCLLDADDWWTPDKVRRVVERFDAEPELGIVQHPCQETTPEGAPSAKPASSLPARYVARDYVEGTCICLGTTGLSFRASALREIRPVPEALRICADGYLFYLILRAPVGNLAEVLGFRRVHGTNGYMSRFSNPDKLELNRTALRVLGSELDRLLRVAGLELSPHVRRSQHIEELLEGLLLARYRHRWADTYRFWSAYVGEYRGVARAAKAATLLIAVASPPAYLHLLNAYARLRAS